MLLSKNLFGNDFDKKINKSKKQNQATFRAITFKEKTI